MTLKFWFVGTTEVRKSHFYHCFILRHGSFELCFVMVTLTPRLSVYQAMECGLCISQVSWENTWTWKREWRISGLVYSKLQHSFTRALHLGVIRHGFP
jgi:hypothetical protein